MKHFIGGFALGWFIGIFMPRNVPNILVALIVGISAWGLLP